jgi:hypothetical protein
MANEDVELGLIIDELVRFSGRTEGNTVAIFGENARTSNKSVYHTMKTGRLMQQFITDFFAAGRGFVV